MFHGEEAWFVANLRLAERKTSELTQTRQESAHAEFVPSFSARDCLGEEVHGGCVRYLGPSACPLLDILGSLQRIQREVERRLCRPDLSNGILSTARYLD